MDGKIEVCDACVDVKRNVAMVITVCIKLIAKDWLVLSLHLLYNFCIM